MSNDLLTLNDIYEYDFSVSYNVKGIFFQSLMGWNTIPSAMQEPAVMAMIDQMYFSHSGEKYISPFVRNVYNSVRTDKLNYLMGAVTKAIKAKYSESWKRIFATWAAEYDPISNYDMIENGINDITTFQRGTTQTRTFTDRETSRDNRLEARHSQTRTPNLSTTDNNGIYGYNSTSAVPADTRTQTQTGTDTVAENNTDITSESIKEKGSESVGQTGTDTNTRNYTLTRTGNIGVTTSQQMLQSEIDLWSNWDLFENTIFPDLDKLLTLKIY